REPRRCRTSPPPHPRSRTKRLTPLWVPRVGSRRRGTVHAEGGLDFRARWPSTGRRRSGSAPSASASPLESTATEEQLAALPRLTERYCVVHQRLARTPSLSVS